MAIMRFEIELTDEAQADMKALSAAVRRSVRTALEAHLRNEPRRVSRSRIKRLTDLAHPQYRLRVADYRVYYNVEGQTVTIHGVVSKAWSNEWLRLEGVQE